jgi:hypothetical protein
MSAWTPERRAAQAAAIQRWRPWEHATGPRTPEGKARVALNGYRGGRRRQERLILHALRAGLNARQDALRNIQNVKR